MTGPDENRKRPHIGERREVFTVWFWRDMLDLLRDMRRWTPEQREQFRREVSP